jgi:multiple sugar transport system permease protein
MLAIITIVIIYPLFYLVKLSFTNTNNINLLSGTSRFIGLKNFVGHFNDKAFLKSMWNTLYFTIISVGISTLFGILIAYIIYPMKVLFKNLMLACVLLPALIAETACGLMFKPMLNTTIGIFNYLLGIIGIEAINYLGDKNLAQWAIIWLNVWQWTPYMFIFVLSGIEGLNVSYFEVAKLEGASDLQVLWHVVLPLTKPIILVALFFRITNALRLFDKVYVITGGGPGFATDTITSYIQRIGIQRMEFGYSSASGIIMLIFTAIIGAIAMKFMYDSNT